jgi:uncharacterized membrane protein
LSRSPQIHLHIAAVFLAVVLPVASAQQSSPTQLTIQVKDETGWFVPGARIAIDPSPIASGSVLMADSQGQAILDLPAGSYTLSIAASGFKKWGRQIDMQSRSGQRIRATLEIAEPDSPTVIAFSRDIPLESPEPVYLSLQPESSSAPLPHHRARRRW